MPIEIVRDAFALLTGEQHQSPANVYGCEAPQTRFSMREGQHLLTSLAWWIPIEAFRGDVKT